MPKPALQPPTPRGTASVQSWVTGSSGRPRQGHPRRAVTPSSHQSRLNAFPGSAPRCPVATPISGRVRSFLRTRGQRPGAEHPPAPSPTTGHAGSASSLHIPSRKASGRVSPGPHPAGSTAPRPAQPFPAESHPPQRVGRGERDCSESKPAHKGSALLGSPPSPARPGMAGSSPARHGDGGSAGLQPGLCEAWEAQERGMLDTGAGRGPAGALPAQTGSCSQLMAAWQRAGSEDRLHFIWPRREGGGTPGGEVTGCPMPGMRSSASTLGDIPTAQPFAVPSHCPWMFGYPACPSCASPPSRANPSLAATAGGHVFPLHPLLDRQ